MRRVKILLGWSSEGLEKATNKWLEENPNLIIHDIKLDVCSGKRTESEYVALIIYSQ